MATAAPPLRHDFEVIAIVGAAHGVAEQGIDQFLHGVGFSIDSPDAACARSGRWQLPFLTGVCAAPAKIAAIITSRCQASGHEGAQDGLRPREAGKISPTLCLRSHFFALEGCCTPNFALADRKAMPARE